MKIVYEYKAVQVPCTAKKLIDDLYEEQKKSNKKVRKADLWLQAVEQFVQSQKMGQ